MKANVDQAKWEAFVFWFDGKLLQILKKTLQTSRVTTNCVIVTAEYFCLSTQIQDINLEVYINSVVDTKLVEILEKCDDRAKQSKILDLAQLNQKRTLISFYTCIRSFYLYETMLLPLTTGPKVLVLSKKHILL